MSEMVERVARILNKAHYERGRGIAPEWETIDKFTQEMWRFSARAAIEAMREPPHNVIMAAKNVIDEPLLDERLISLVPGLMYQAWAAGVDEALK